jgi:ABC-2 type transport system permease protein
MGMERKMMHKIKTIIAKEWAEVFKNRMVLFTITFMPLLMTAIPLVILGVMGQDMSEIPDLGSVMPGQFNEFCPPNLQGGECFQVYLASQFMLLFMIMPLIIPATIAAYSIVGEKATKSLEPLLATPITTLELLVGKSLAAIIPAVLATYGSFLLFLGGALILVSNREIILALADARWLLSIFLVGPLLALGAVSLSVMVSSRVNDPRVAEQISAVVILPVIALFFGQMAGLFLINRSLVLIAAVALAALDALLFYLATRLFQRETILTRWK